MSLTLILRDGDTTLREKTLTEAEEAALLDALPGHEGIADWILGALAGKINNSTKRMGNDAIEALKRGDLTKDDVIDFTPSALASALAKSPNYKNRKARDAAGERITPAPGGNGNSRPSGRI